jgi:hypothetical protein
VASSNRPWKLRVHPSMRLGRGANRVDLIAAGTDLGRHTGLRTRPTTPSNTSSSKGFQTLPSGASNAVACRGIVKGCDEDEGDGRVPRGQLLLQLEPGHALHLDIHEGHGRAPFGFGSEEVAGRAVRLDGVAGRVEQSTNGPADRAIIVYDGDHESSVATWQVDPILDESPMPCGCGASDASDLDGALVS